LSARAKLNAVTIQITLIAAGIIGLLFQSWAVFGIAAAVLLACALHQGDIRPPRRRR
jgi:hypothetical protein